MKQGILAIDQGTTSSRVILFDLKGKILSVQQKELPLHCPHNGWVEQDPARIWKDVKSCLADVAKDAKKQGVTPIAIGITNQRETVVVWDRKTGKPLYNAIVWQDRRTADYCTKLRKKNVEDMIADKTGLLIDPYFSGSKIAWVLENVKGARDKAKKGELAVGTIDTWLVWNLTSGKRHVTDATNASRTQLFNIKTQQWDDELLKLFDIPRSMLPDVLDCAADFGVADTNGISLPIAGIAGDQHAALLGQACIEPGMVKATYGTGAFALVNIGAKFVRSENRLLTTMAYRIDGQVTYAIEGSIFVAGAAIQWLRDGISQFKIASESEAIAKSVKDTGGVYFVPAFTGLGAPYWDPHARGAIVGLVRDTTSAHIARAALEAQAYQTHDLIQAMEADTQKPIARLRADGGLVSNKLVCQMLADTLQIPIDLPVITETTALGAAFLAGLGVGAYKDLSDLPKLWKQAKTYTAKVDKKDMKPKLDGWAEAVGRVRTAQT
jgi:glycerol kinase